MFGRVSIRTQVVALLAVSQVIAIATIMILIRPVMEGERQPLPVAIAAGGLAPLIALVGVVEQLPERYVDVVIAAALDHESQLRVVDAIEPLAQVRLPFPAHAGLRALRDSFPDIAPERLAVARQKGQGWHPLNFVRYEAGYQLADGRWIVLTPTDNNVARSFPPLFLFMIVLLLVLPAAAILTWVGASLVAPVAQLAKRAETFGSHLDAEPIEPRGPREVRVLAETLNDMYGRIRQLIHARSLSLAAIGHDLRTPLTRLRLRAEMLNDGEMKTAILRDTATMVRMIDSALTYIRDQGEAGAAVAFDLSALLHTVADDIDNTGKRIDVKAPKRLVATGVPEQFKRTIGNLLENALQHALHAVVDLTENADRLVLTISDNGPGIPANERERLLRPFERGDKARGGDAQSGFGLGLAIANDIIVKHGGELTLEDNAPSGLRVVIDLPRVSGEPPAER